MINIERTPTSKIEQQKETEISPEYVHVAEQALRGYLALKPEEKTLLIKDQKTDAETSAILEKAIDIIGSARREIFLSKKVTRKDIQNLLKQHKTVISIAGERHDADDEIYDDIKESGSRLLALFDLDKKAFNPNGSVAENPQEMAERLNTMEALFSKAVGFKITSVYGTNLEVPLRVFGERKWIKETGITDKPGEWNNLPAGEIFTTPDEFKVNGVLMLPVLESTLRSHQGVDEFIKLTIKDGLIIAIDGGKSADFLRKKLAKASKKDLKDNKDPWRPYRIAEIAFGANSKARSTVADPEQSYDYPGVSVVEAEKRLGTMHIAFGDAKHGEEGAEGFLDAASHYDFVIPRNGLTVEMFTRERDFQNKNNGQKIINDGSINFL